MSSEISLFILFLLIVALERGRRERKLRVEGRRGRGTGGRVEGAGAS